jgi:hypothetical protein
VLSGEKEKKRTEDKPKWQGRHMQDPPLTFLTGAISKKQKRNKDKPEWHRVWNSTSQNETRQHCIMPQDQVGESSMSQSKGREVVALSRRGRLRERDTGGECNNSDEGRCNTWQRDGGNATMATRGNTTCGKGTCEKKGSQQMKKKRKKDNKKSTRCSITPHNREQKGAAL